MNFTKEKAPNFELLNEANQKITLSSLISKSPLMIVFYPGDFTPVCTKQLCEYRDSFEDFTKLGIQIIGVSKNTPEEHKSFKEKYNFQFHLLSDPSNKIAKAFNCGSKWMFGAVSRAIVIVDQNQDILYRYVENLPITRRKVDEIQETILSLQIKKTT